MKFVLAPQNGSIVRSRPHTVSGREWEKGGRGGGQLSIVHVLFRHINVEVSPKQISSEDCLL